MKGNRALIILLPVLLLLLASGVLAQSGGDYDVEWNVIGSAGDQFVSGGDYQIGFTLAQDQEPLISSGGNYQILQGYWSGGAGPTAVKLLGLWVEAHDDALVVYWETAIEVDTLGFNLYRSENGEAGTYSQLNEGLIPAQRAGEPGGASYEWADLSAAPGPAYFYLLEDVDAYGQATTHGPVQGALPYPQIFLPLLVKGF